MTTTSKDGLTRSLVALLEVGVNADRRMEEAQDKTQHLIYRARKALAEVEALDRVRIPQPKYPVQDVAAEYDIVPNEEAFEKVLVSAMLDYGLLQITDADGHQWRARAFVVFDRADDKSEWAKNRSAAQAETL